MEEPVTASPVRDAGPAQYGAWNPGIQSELPWELLPRSTIFSPENAFTTVEQVHELSRATGLETDELVVFRPERLVVHELLVRVTAELSVPDGPRVEDLGISFRELMRVILTRYIAPHMRGIIDAYGALRRALSTRVDAELAAAFSGLSAEAGAGSLLGLLRPPRPSPGVAGGEDRWLREEQLSRQWAEKARSSADPLARAASARWVESRRRFAGGMGGCGGIRRCLPPSRRVSPATSTEPK